VPSGNVAHAIRAPLPATMVVNFAKLTELLRGLALA
jgi:hypothetical protein